MLDDIFGDNNLTRESLPKWKQDWAASSSLRSLTLVIWRESKELPKIVTMIPPTAELAILLSAQIWNLTCGPNQTVTGLNIRMETGMCNSFECIEMANKTFT